MGRPVRMYSPSQGAAEQPGMCADSRALEAMARSAGAPTRGPVTYCKLRPIGAVKVENPLERASSPEGIA